MKYSFGNLTELKSGLDVSDVAYTMHFQDSSNLVFSMPSVSNKVIQITMAGSTANIYYGDSWTSGTTLVNKVTVIYQTNALVNGILVFKPNLFAIAYNADAGNMYNNLALFGKASDNSFYLLMGSGGNSSDGGWRNLSTGDVLIPIIPTFPILSPSGNYYTNDLRVKNASNVLQPYTFPNLKWLTRSMVLKELSYVIGNDIAVAVDRINSNSIGVKGLILIENGNV